MNPDLLQTKTEFTEVERAVIDRYARVILDQDDIPVPGFDIPDGTGNWNRALFVPTIGKVFEGINSQEGYNAITQRNMAAITDNSGISTVVFEGDAGDKFIVLESPADVPTEYTPYEL
jgi:hypothetical protein